MAFSIEITLIGLSLLLIFSVIASKISDRFGIPALLLFLGIGMLAGSDGPGGIYFDDPVLAQNVGMVALALILFSGGLDTTWKGIRPVLREGIALATLGVFLTALIVGGITHYLMGFDWLDGFLLGAIISSTDAAAVFSVLRARGVSLTGKLKPLLELESGSNDPMAVFLTVGMVQLITQEVESAWLLAPLFFKQMILGALFGLGMGKLTLFMVNRLRLGYEGLYPVLTFAVVLMTFGLTNAFEGSGFLAVYLVGIVMGKEDFLHKRSLLRFYDGLAWLMQIIMFLTLGLLVFPSRIVPVIGTGLLISVILLLVARPASVFLSLAFSRLNFKEKTFISWIGLRGAVPIVLATYPLLARLPQADLFFNVVFFVVISSVLLQGTSIPKVAHWLKVYQPLEKIKSYPIVYHPHASLNSELMELAVPLESAIDGKAIVDLRLPADFLVILVARGDGYIIPSGATVIQGGDTLLVLSDESDYQQVQAQVEEVKPTLKPGKPPG